MSEGLHNATYMGEQVTSQEVLLLRRELAASQEQMSLRLAGFDAQMAEASRQFQRLRNDTDHLRIAQAPPPSLPHTPNLRIRPPEKFTPPGMNISTWLYSTSMYLEAHNCLGAAALPYLPQLLGGNALQWYKNLADEAQGHPFAGWVDFAAGLRLQFLPSNHHHLVRQQLRGLSQLPGSVPDYTAAFRALASELPKMDEGDAVYIYMQGLDPVIRTAVSLREHTTVASASAMAARVSSQQQVYTPTSSTPISLRHPIPSGTVMPTGFAPSFPPVAEPMDLSAMDVKEVKCHRCHKLGHYARMCKAATPHPDNKA